VGRSSHCGAGAVLPADLCGSPTRSQHLIPVARTCGALRADAEGRGITVPSNDAWVASCCITFGYPLLTLNRKHFEPLAVSGLRLF
jgi:hypothetical protein